MNRTFIRTIIKGELCKIDEKNDAGKYLDFLCALAPALQKLIPVDCIIGISDNNKFICSLPGENVNLPENNTGTVLPSEAPIAKAIRERKPQKMISPKEVLGIEFQATAIPIFDMQGNIIGGMGLGIGMENKDIVTENSKHVAVSTEYVKKNVDDLSISAEELAQKQKYLLELTNDITNQINETQRIIEIINKISHTSNILGINAAIEASRAGNEGKGFAVVAAEVRKMAEDSRKAVVEVESMLYGIKDKILQIDEEVNQTTDIGSRQANATRELSNIVTVLSETAKKLQEASEEVVG